MHQPRAKTVASLLPSTAVVSASDSLATKRSASISRVSTGSGSTKRRRVEALPEHLLSDMRGVLGVLRAYAKVCEDAVGEASVRVQAAAGRAGSVQTATGLVGPVHVLVALAALRIRTSFS